MNLDSAVGRTTCLAPHALNHCCTTPLPAEGPGNISSPPAFVNLAALDLGAYEFDLRTLVTADWLQQYGLDPTDPHVCSSNPDQDGQTTFQEWVADTNPTNEQSYFRIDHIEVKPNGSGATVHFQSSANRVYTLHCATDLGEGGWSDVPGQTGWQESGPIDMLSDTNSAPHRFYRVGVALPQE